MTHSPTDIRPDEDDALTPEVRAEIEAFAARHRHDPPLAVLRAASVEALPSTSQDGMAAALASSPWRQQIVAGANDAESDAALSPAESAALLARIHRMHRNAVPTRPAARSPLIRNVVRFGLPLLAAAALVYVTVRVRPPAPSPTALPDSAAVSAPTVSAPPTYRIAVDVAPVKLTTSALVRRSPGQAGVFTDDAAPAFAAYRAGRFGDAAKAFDDLARTYPAAPEAAFYLGVSRLLSGDQAGAVSALTAAQQLNDPTFRDDVAWYLAAAEERVGDMNAARRAITTLCQGHSSFAARACETAAKFPAK